MKHRRPDFKGTPQNSNKHAAVKPSTRKKTIEFKKKIYEFLESEMENKIEMFNKTIVIPSPNNKEMVLFVDKFSWTPSKSLIDATIFISVTYPNTPEATIYTSKNIAQIAKGIRNVNLLYSIQAGGVINVDFECEGYDVAHPKFSFDYKWLDPQFGKNPYAVKR